MNIGLVSDTHNQQQKVRAALKVFREYDVTTVLHAGDVTSESTLALFKGFDLWIARGNMDRGHRLEQKARELFGFGRLRLVHDLHLEGARIAMTHGDSWERLTALVNAEAYDYVIHGHTHAPNDERIGATRVINPGALGHARWHAPTCAVLFLATDDLQWIEL